LNTRSLTALVLVTGLPAFLDILSYTGNILVTLNYEPVGVAIFAVGVLYVVDDRFVALPAFWREEILESLTDPVIAFDHTGRVRDYNSAALEDFPELDETLEKQLATEYPELAAELATGSGLLEFAVDDTIRYYVVEKRSLSIEDRSFGEVVVLSDVTVLEEQRRELERQNDQFDEFAEAITHELRNTLAIAQGYLREIGDEMITETDSKSADFYERVDSALTRMDTVTTDLSKLARYGQTLEDLDECDFREIVAQGWEGAETDGLTLSIESEGTFNADRVRLIDLFKNAFDFAKATDSSRVSVGLDATEIWIETDGEVFSPERIDAAFQYGEAVPSAETGMLLPNIRTIGRVHGWQVTVDPTYQRGLRLQVAMN
jgi:signal transduction histidine kinase